MRTKGFLIVAACAVAVPLSVEHGRVEAERAARAARDVPAMSAVDAPGDAAGDLVHYAGGTLRVEFDAAELRLPRADLLAWVRESARATATYFGRFPVPYARLIFEPARGGGVTMGRAVGRPEPRIVVTMGRRANSAALAGESLLVHEMVHLAIPDHDLRHLWLHEGIATYVEHVAQAQAGIVPARVVWAALMRELPAGLPDPLEPDGLDDTQSEGRRYWGGALFCLLADIEIRKATGNRLGLQDALRALQRQGGNLARLWTIERTLEVADRATGTTVLTGLYRTMGKRPLAADLHRLWRELGVRRDWAGQVVLDDSAPLAAVRRAITDRPSAPLLVSPPRLLRVANLPAGQGRRR